jgi:hypothetical protein
MSKILQTVGFKNASTRLPGVQLIFFLKIHKTGSSTLSALSGVSLESPNIRKKSGGLTVHFHPQ